MADNGHNQFYLVDGNALPEVFIRVTQARELLDTGRAQTVAEAAEAVGISRSAYYKYKESGADGLDMDAYASLSLQEM